MLEVIKFELSYRLRRPATYIYFVLLFLLSFLAVTTDIVQAGGSGGKIMENAPTVIVSIMLFMGFLSLFIASAVMGVPVLRDFEHATASMLFTTPLKKGQYIFGRFFGSFIILVLISSGIILGMMLGHVLPWPWLDNAENLLPFTAYHYLHPFLVFMLPNLFFFGAIFFAGGTLGKKMTVVYAQAVILFMGYLVAQQFIADLDNRDLGAILDPFGFGANFNTIQYWTVAEQNTTLIPFAGTLMLNRLVWLLIGLVSLLFTYFRFSYNMAGNAGKKAKKSVADVVEKIKDIAIPQVVLQYGLKSSLIQIKELSLFYFKWMIKQLPFVFISLAGVIFIFIIAFTSDSGGYDISTYPTTSWVLSMIGIFNVFFIILIVFYSGELIWKERDVKINLIYDALPFPNFVSLAGKYFGFALTQIVVLLGLIVVGVLIQLLKGYTLIEFDLYFKTLFTDTLFLMLLYTLLGFFIQVVVNHKFLGFALMIIFYISFIVMGELGIEHTLFYFGRAGLGQYSDMNNFGHYVSPFSWLNIYWFAFGLVLFAIAIVFSVRGTDTILKTRLQIGKGRFTRSIVIFVLASVAIFGLSGSYIYYNTNVINEYTNSKDRQKLQARYEKELKKYEYMVQPKIVESNLQVDIFPKDRDFKAIGFYILKNKSNEVIMDIHIQKGGDFQFETTVDFEKKATLKEDLEDFSYQIYKLNTPLKPGDSIKMNFETTFTTEGFVEGGSNTRVIYNGTFFDNTYFPSIGYNEGYELSSDDDRKDNDLEEKERMMERDDPRGLASNLFGDDADFIRFEIVVSTDSSQMAIAPGYLQKKWVENDRIFYHYKMDTPMVNFYSILSAEYQLKEDVWKSPVDSLPDVKLEIYYNKGHEYNLDRMMKGLKKSLTYYTENFSPYQYRQLRIMEFPRYSSFAQSFANTVPFSESIGFIQNIEEDDVDLPFYVTAHEVAHQWWGHQVTEAGVKGNAMLSETMSQYSALMLMKQEYPPEQIKRFLKYELNSYLRGRTFERKKEMPIELVEGQGYIHYRKGSVLMYALQDYISEDSVNMALRRFNRDWSYKEAPYPTSKDLIGYFREVTPDSLQYLIKDMFETITLFENKTTEATYKELSENKYEVSFTIDAIKYRADSLGNESSIPLQDWIDIGVFAEDEKGEDKLIYLKKHKIDNKETTFTIKVDEKPIKAGIDPINKLIDRNPDDNMKTVELEETSYAFYLTYPSDGSKTM